MVNFKLPRGPNSLSGGVKNDVDVNVPYVSRTVAVEYDDEHGASSSRDARYCRLRVIARARENANENAAADDDDDDDDTSTSECVYAHPHTVDALGQVMAARPWSRRGGGDGGACVRFVAGADVPLGCVVMTAAQRYNLRACLERALEFEVVDDECLGLVDCTFELGRLDGASGRLDGASARKAVRAAFGGIDRVLTTGEVFMLSINGDAYKVRVAETNSLSAIDASKTIGYHCFRGRARAETAMYVRALNDAKLTIDNNDGVKRSIRLAKREVIQVKTRDGETFPVHRALLRQCIALTGAVRRAGEAGKSRNDDDDDADEVDHVSVDIDVDTDVFDRVLIFLEAAELSKPPPTYDIRITETLSTAAETLGCRTLGDWCAHRLGAYASRLREYSWDEIVEHNASGGVWLCIDGMVLDVKRWLGEHPGGDVIIPNQSLNIDASRHFEMYHSSRESFLYLKEFYIGEVATKDRARIPVPETRASDDFLAQLRAYTTFRLVSDAKVHVHLGQ